MSRTITISGHSDDTIVIEGNGNGIDEISCYGLKGESIVVTGTDGRAVRLRVRYEGAWSIEAGPVDDEITMLTVTIIGDDNGYSAKAIIEDATTLVHEARVSE